MALASGLSQAALLAAAGACVALACGSTTIDLLPERESDRAGAGSGGVSAGQGSAGAQGGTDVGGTTTQAAAGTEAGGGKFGGAAGSMSCDGGACGGGGNSNTGGFANSCPFGACQSCFNDNHCLDWLYCSERLGNVCVECDDEVACRPGERCNLASGRCDRVCERDDQCSDDRVCDPMLKLCVFCSVDQQCLSDQNDNTRRCVFNHCFECAESTDCPKGPRQICAGWRCVECEFDEDCGFDQHCDLGECQ